MPSVILPASQAIVVPATASPNGSLAVGGQGLLTGFSLEETTGAAAARCVVRDGGTNTGGALLTLRFAAGQAVGDVFPGKGLIFEGGLFVDVTAGSVGGSLFVILHPNVMPWEDFIGLTAIAEAYQ